MDHTCIVCQSPTSGFSLQNPEEIAAGKTPDASRPLCDGEMCVMMIKQMCPHFGPQTQLVAL